MRTRMLGMLVLWGAMATPVWAQFSGIVDAGVGALDDLGSAAFGSVGDRYSFGENVIDGDVTFRSDVSMGDVDQDPGSELRAGSVQMYQTNIGGDFEFNSHVETGDVQLGAIASLDIGSFSSWRSTFDGDVTFNANASTGDIELGVGARAWIASVSVRDSSVGGDFEFDSNVDIGDLTTGAFTITSIGSLRM